ncbi:hypothetical protein HFO06_36420 [Rhizobium leguminosarum]|uniref:hypothetical protein n=1 Tax=Rhizobium leguminosarum TaxID=384 RepID=UPI001C9757FA|nr:hypothetical protein [Rhizobium leguminosarum]MBY5768468.1 hypothetical protein [Rhizobium leguminosarum]
MFQLEHSESYQWIGSFWFVDTDGMRGEEFAGEVTYKPGHGIQLRFSSPQASFEDGNREVARKIVHGIVRQQNTAVRVTLYNVWGVFGAFMGRTQMKTMNGKADMIVLDEHLRDDWTYGLQVQYDDAFEDMLITRKEGPGAESERVRLSSAPAITLADRVVIAYRLTTTLSDLRSIDDLSGIFWSVADGDLTLLKRAISPLFETGDYGLRNSAMTIPTINIETQQSKIVDVFDTEKTFRRFWSLVGDQTLSVRKLWLRTPARRTETGEVLYAHHAALLSENSSMTQTSSNGRRLRNMPLHLYTFEAKEHSLSNAQASIASWFEICTDKRFEPVVDGVERLVAESDKMTDRTRYNALLSEVETFLDLCNVKRADVDALVDHYASEEWRASFDRLREPLLDDETPGKFAHEVRNVIAHPKSAAKKANGRYAAVLADRVKFQSVYAHLGGLLVKAVLTKLGGIDQAAIEEFARQFVEVRASFEKIHYE